MGQSITIVKLSTALALTLTGCLTTHVANESGKASLHDLIAQAIEVSSLREDMKRGCRVSLEDQFREQIGTPYEGAKDRRFNGVFFLGSEYVSMSSVVLERSGKSLALTYRDMDGKHATRSAEQSELKRAFDLIESAARYSRPNESSRVKGELHESCVVFLSNGDSKSLSVVAASMIEGSSTPAGQASALLQSLIE